jgi:hypothetical protein
MHFFKQGTFPENLLENPAKEAAIKRPGMKNQTFPRVSIESETRSPVIAQCKVLPLLHAMIAAYRIIVIQKACRTSMR